MTMQAKDISDEQFLAGVERTMQLRPSEWATRWDLAAVLAGDEAHVQQTAAADRGDADYPEIVNYPHMPEKVVLAKARKLIKRGLLYGCGCGCRGDFVSRVGRGDGRVT